MLNLICGKTARAGCVKVLLCASMVLALASCTGLHNLGMRGDPLAGFRPFHSVDHASLTLTKATAAAADKRGRPASEVLGKRSITLEDCRGLALGYNLELQVARLEEVSKAAIEQSAKKKVLPTVSYTGRLEERDNYRWAYSDTMANQGFQGGTSDGVASMSTGSERTNFTQTLEAGWSPTDAALNFYMARSGGNDRLKAHYQRVRVAQQLVGKVDAAYYRLLSLQEALPFARRLTAVRNSVDGAMRELHGKQLKEMADFHRVREKSIRAEQELVALQAELERQRDVLATALGISPESCMDGGFYVCGVIAKPCFSGKMCDLEMVAIRNRPEAYQAGLDNLNSVNDLKRTVIRHFPTMRTYWRFSWDKSKYILEKDWRDVGVTVSFDLVQWLANRDENKSAAANVARTDREMANIAVGITSQVRIAALKYYEAMETVRNSERFLANTRALVKDAEVRAERDKLDELAFSELKGDVLSERVRNIRAIGEANATLAELQAAMGTNYSEPVDCK